MHRLPHAFLPYLAGHRSGSYFYDKNQQEVRQGVHSSQFTVPSIVGWTAVVLPSFALPQGHCILPTYLLALSYSVKNGDFLF